MIDIYICISVPLILRILELFTTFICHFLTYSIVFVCLYTRITREMLRLRMRTLGYYFYINTNTQGDFQTCISVPLNSDISSDSQNLDIPGFRLIRSDHLSNDKQGGVCVYFKSPLRLQILSISMLHNCINLEIRIDDKLCNLICLCRSPSQKLEEFATFIENLELNLELIFTQNPYVTVVIDGFNVKAQNWYKGNKTTASGTKLEIVTSHYRLTQIINEPTHTLEDV